jgi:hypothetical protein
MLPDVTETEYLPIYLIDEVGKDSKPKRSHIEIEKGAHYEMEKMDR